VSINEKKITIADLVEKYHSERSGHKKASYNETQLRIDFLDPFFELLGWDIKNKNNKPTNEREVLLEEPLKADATSNTKKPDYTFRLFSERKFFVEAKKPDIAIHTDNEPAKQVRRYGFTAKLKISVLSNFEYLAIYDCSKSVNQNDAPTVGRIKLYHYTDYVEAFEEIKHQLGHESVYTGEFDIIWKAIENQLSLSSVDTLFIQQINDWRLMLGKEVFSHNQEVSNEELNDIVQNYLNSIIFLRVCEDRALETYKTLLNFANNKDFNALIGKFKAADKKYNAGLFNHPLTQEIISDNSSAFWDIINQLYFPESTYSFSVFSSDILGNIYEIYISKQLLIESGSVVLISKPDNADRDVVTTPTLIINDILRHTVREFCLNKTDEEIFSASFADIACGSGAFLLETYQLLQDILVDYYLINNPTHLIPTSVETYKLPFSTKRKLLTNCIFGVDKDYSAVEACKFGLLLKLLENENNNSITIPALPDLNKNIFYGNSLIESSVCPDNLEETINPFDFGEIRFDVIVGNPPYMATEEMKNITPSELPLYKKHYQTAHKQFDKYYLFIERGHSLLKDGGYFGYIIPIKFTKVGAGTNLRKYLVENQAIEKLVSFGANQVFHGKTTYTCLLILRKLDLPETQYIEVNNFNDWKIRNTQSVGFDKVKTNELKADGWLLIPQHLKPIFAQIQSNSQSLGDLVGDKNIYNGIQTSANPIYIHKAIREDDDYIYFLKNKRTWKIEKELTKPYFKTTAGKDNLYTYRPFKPNAFVIYPYVKINGAIKFVEFDQLKTEYPEAFAYLMHYKDKLNSPSRSIEPAPKTDDEWYRYGRHQSLDKCDVPAKIIVGVLSQGNKYAIDYHGTLISSGGTAGYCVITLPEDFPLSIYYIQALLNSKYLEWFSALIGEIFRGGYIARGTKVLKKLPIRTIDFSDKNDVLLHQTISEIQKKLIDIQTKIDKQADNERKSIPLKRQFLLKKSELDDALKCLYNLGEKDSLIPLISEMYATN